MTTYLGLGVALPHVRVKMSRRYVLAIGRSPAGIRYDGLKDNERIHLIIMLLADEPRGTTYRCSPRWPGW